MRLSILQSALQWEAPAANRDMFARKIQSLYGNTDLIVLPEMFTTGFSMNAAALAEPMEGPTVDWMAQQARLSGAAVTGSFICKENDLFYNRLVWMQPDGHFRTYDKRHLFGLADEHLHYQSGNQRLLVQWLGWTICPFICYDLRFPEWIRQPKDQYYDLLLFVANWPVARAHHWRSLLTARAIENQCYLAAVNICGVDGKGLEYSGDSSILDFTGQSRCQISGSEGVFTTELDLEPMHAFRKRLPFLEDMK
jgi:predicted amidohydrolase